MSFSTASTRRCGGWARWIPGSGTIRNWSQRSCRKQKIWPRKWKEFSPIDSKPGLFVALGAREGRLEPRTTSWPESGIICNVVNVPHLWRRFHNEPDDEDHRNCNRCLDDRAAGE